MLPVSESAIREAREEIPDHRGIVLDGEEGSVLVIRCPGAPDLVEDIEEAAIYVDEDDLDAGTVLLAGPDAVTKVDPPVLKRQVDERRDRDADSIQRLRRELEQPFDYTLHRRRPRRDVLRLAVHVPRREAADLAREDLPRLADNLLPLRETPKGREVDVVYVVAEDDFARMDAERFFEDLRQATRDDGDERDVGAELLSRLTARGYTILQGDEREFVHVAAEAGGRRILAGIEDSVDAEDVTRAAKAVEASSAHGFLWITANPTPDARRAALGAPVELIHPDDVAEVPV